MRDVLHWLLDFIGVNNGDNSFSTHMYNFWSGFGGNISVLALGGTVFGVYRHNLRRLARLNPLHHHPRHARAGNDADAADDADDADDADASEPPS